MPLRAIGQPALPERPKIPNPGEKCGLASSQSLHSASRVSLLPTAERPAFPTGTNISHYLDGVAKCGSREVEIRIAYIAAGGYRHS